MSRNGPKLSSQINNWKNIFAPKIKNDLENNCRINNVTRILGHYHSPHSSSHRGLGVALCAPSMIFHNYIQNMYLLFISIIITSSLFPFFWGGGFHPTPLSPIHFFKGCKDFEGWQIFHSNSSNWSIPFRLKDYTMTTYFLFIIPVSAVG